MATNSEVSDGILLKFKLIRAFIDGHVTWKNEEDPYKNEVTIVVRTFLSLLVYGIFQDAQEQLTHKSLIRSCRISKPSEIL